MRLGHARGNGSKHGRHRHGALEKFRGLYHGGDSFRLAAGILDADNVRVLRQFCDDLNRQIVQRKRRHAVEHYRQRRVIRNCTKVGQHFHLRAVRSVQLVAIKVWRAHQHRIVAEACRTLGHHKRLPHALLADPRQHHFVRRSGGNGNGQHFPLLLLAEHDRFTGRAKHHHSRKLCPRVARNIMFQLP